ncbi:PREDICTED: protein tramtrack, beta isoform-like isoform X4 [Papilio polytes]|uniref:protein tramtrack, beta isoform-like isoform X4 n=1 Tax=Papilio polytes TaxID=76194 RepID=UPI000675C7E3|nr:PREDICTED: protein tramtrack, beta isoform-like isoform X4 [Papilio polytes]
MASSDEQFSLCWNNFHANMSAGFHGLLSRGDLVDVTLAAEGRILQAHKLVLSVCSPYFQEMFKMNPNQHPIVFLKDVSHSALRDLLQFMYQGEVNVKQEELASFISTAEQLQVKGLTGNQNEESSTPSKPKPTSRPGPRSSQQRISAKLETDLDSKPSLTPVAIKRPNRPSIASNNSSSSQSGPAKRKCVDPLEAGPSGSAKDEFVTIPDEDENNAVAPKMEPEFVNESMWDDDDEGANNDETNFGEDDSNMEMSGFDGSATGDGNISGGGEGGAVGDAQEIHFILSKRGQNLLVYKQYTFAKNCVSKAKTSWTCSSRRSKNCKAQVVLTNDGPEKFDDKLLLKNEYIEVLEGHEDDVKYAADKDYMALVLESKNGKTILHHRGYQYIRSEKTDVGSQWTCAITDKCNAFLFLDNENDIIMSNLNHDHVESVDWDQIDLDDDDSAIVISSRKGKDILLFRKYTYRKQYNKSRKSRWVCSTFKNCRAHIFTDRSNTITLTNEDHCHAPPKYYLDPDNVLLALQRKRTSQLKIDNNQF